MEHLPIQKFDANTLDNPIVIDDDDDDNSPVPTAIVRSNKNPLILPPGNKAEKRQKTTTETQVDWMRLLINKYASIPSDFLSKPIPRKRRWDSSHSSDPVPISWNRPIIISSEDVPLLRNTELYEYSSTNIVLCFEVSSSTLPLSPVKDHEAKLDVNRWK